MNVWWHRIRSWHALRSASDPRTVCGRALRPDKDGITEIVTERPSSEKTCENCLRLVAPK
jgi:hypothetical protein